MSETQEKIVENGLCFRFDETFKKLFAVFSVCENKIELTKEIVRQRLEVLKLDHLFIADHLLFDFIRRYKNAKEGFEAEIGEARDATCDIRLPKDKMEATLMLTPCFGGKPLTLEDIKQLLTEKGIVYGVVSDEEIEKMLAAGSAINFVVAKGLPTIPGTDTQFQNLMPEIKERKPHIDLQGTVDYRELGEIVTVHKGDVVMRRIPPVEGKKGYNVMGDLIMPYKGKDIPFSPDKKGVYVDPNDSNQLLSETTGMPVAVPQGIIVQPIFTVRQVDFKSGNVHFDGAVIVKGDVMEGMKVYALEDVIIEGSVIDGIVESGGNISVKGSVIGTSQLNANGEITVKSGVQGYKLTSDYESENPFCKIVARGSVMLNFVEHFSVESSMDIIIEKYALSSKLLAESKISVGKIKSKKAAIIGGTAWAMMGIKAGALGAESGIRTCVHAGLNPYIQQRIDELKKQLEPNLQEQDNVKKILNFIEEHPEKNKDGVSTRLTHTLNKLIMDAQLYEAELHDLNENLTLINDAKITAEVIVYAGVEVQLANLFWKAEENRTRSVFAIGKENKIVINAR